MYEDFPELDIGLYGYRTLFGRFKFWGSVPLNTEAEVFAGIIRDAEEYKTIILIGHSMGGLLCMAAIRYLLNTRQSKALSRISGLLLMATPQMGSQRVPKLLSWLSRDFHALKPHGSVVADIHTTFVNSIARDKNMDASGKTVIPTWAILGASDFWVDQLSASIGLSERQKKLVRGSHTMIVKPRTKQADAYLFVHERIQACLRRCEGMLTQGTAPLPTFLPASSVANQLPVLANPFQTAGPLPEHSRAYVKRQCERVLMDLLQEHPLITVHGEYQIGKSSLLIRMRMLLREQWNIFAKDLGLWRTDNEALFMAEFFKMVGAVFGRIETWDELVTNLRRQRSIFLLDELGMLSSAVAEAFIPKLYLLAEEYPFSQ